MSSAIEVNRELTRLDAELRSGGIDRAGFRAKRRKLLLDFEERQTTTTPGAISPSSMTGLEVTVVDAPPDLPFMVHPLPQEPDEKAEEGTGGRSVSTWLMVGLGIGVVVALAVGAWWVFKPAGDSPSIIHVQRPAPAAPATGLITSAETPLTVASGLLETEWTEADVATFLQRWSQLSPESVAAASEDSRIWLLRGETDRRLREAREAESVDQTAELQKRVQELERVQAAIRTP